MESKKINQLATELAPELSDLTIIGDPTTGISKKITLSQMANLFTGTVEEYASLSAFPLVGTADTIYIALDTNVIYRWNSGTSSYNELSPNIVTSLVFSDANGFDGTISLVGSTATLSITTALTAGSVPFIGASGALSQDNANHYWDNTNKRLGINTSSPTTALDVFGSGIIGRINGTSTNNAFLGFSSAGTNKWSIGNVQSDHRFRIYSEANTSEIVSVLQTGEVGIGIANPLTKLHIFGGATALIANLDANTSVAKSISYRSGNSSRINLEVSGTESGSNAGANFFLRAYSDAGALLNTPLTITRATGAASFINSLSVNNATNTDALNIAGTMFLQTSADNSIGGKIYGYNDTSLNLYSGGLKFQTRFFNGSIYVYRDVAAINGLGYLGLGTTTPTDRLHLFGTGVNTQTIICESSASAANAYITHKNALKSYTAGLTVDIGTNNYIIYDNTSSATRFLISSAGNVGIANTTPTAKLDIIGDIRIRRTADTTQFMDIFPSGGEGYIDAVNSASATAQSLIFRRANNASYNESMRITSAGQVCINQTTASAGNYNLNITGAGGVWVKASNSGDAGFVSQGGVGYHFYSINNSGTNTFHVLNNGDVKNTNNSYGAISDIKLKENIEDASPKLEDLLKVKIRNYNLISDESKTKQLGVIAQELEEIFPNMISEYKEMGSEETIKTVKYSVFVPMLIKAIQEQQAQIEELKAKIK